MGRAGLELFERVCQILGYAHSRGVVHCSLTPSNIAVGPFGGVQLLGWGIARVLEAKASGSAPVTRTLDQLGGEDVATSRPASFGSTN